MTENKSEIIRKFLDKQFQDSQRSIRLLRAGLFGCSLFDFRKKKRFKLELVYQEAVDDYLKTKILELTNKTKEGK